MDTFNIKNINSPDFITLLKTGDHGAMDFLVRSYTSHLYKAALGQGVDANSANDMVQSVWMAFYENLKRFEGRSQIRTYLFGILYNKIREHFRASKRIDDHDPIETILESKYDEFDNVIAPPINPENFSLTMESHDVINNCMDALPAMQKAAFVLKEVDGEKTSEICNMMGITHTNLGVLLFRARNRLRECIESVYKEKGGHA
jgi:RNA polymerase sigma-70 factor (ECF subfamily)